MLETIAVLCADVHLSHHLPLARSGEPDWYEAMARPLEEIKGLQDGKEIPIIVAGDIFDRWNSPPKLINFAIRHLSGFGVEAVAGQHDLPHHSWEERHDSAFWTLVESDVIALLSGWKSSGTRLARRGFQWGEELESCEREFGQEVDVTLAVAHRYCWFQHSRHEGVATDENHWKVIRKKTVGYDAVLLGDNHKGFCLQLEGQTFFNAGTLMRRHSDEKECRPTVGLLQEDGSVKLHRLDTSQDVFDSSETVREAELTMIRLDDFLNELQRMGEGGSDFRRAVERTMDREGVSREVRRVVLDSLEGRDEE